MVERLPDMPDGTLGFRVFGEIEDDDYEDVLSPALHAALAAGPLRTLYLIEDVEKIEPDAVWEDMKLGFDLGVRHRKEWERSAIVTDIAWLARAARMFLWMIPGEARVYPRADLAAAKAWVGAGDRTAATT
jgi:SpoIIAA-like